MSSPICCRTFLCTYLRDWGFSLQSKEIKWCDIMKLLLGRCYRHLGITSYSLNASFNDSATNKSFQRIILNSCIGINFLLEPINIKITSNQKEIVSANALMSFLHKILIDIPKNTSCGIRFMRNIFFPFQLDIM